MKRILAVVLVASAVAASAAPKDPVDARVETLLGKMTLEEKLGQLQQLGGPIEGSPELIELAGKGALGSTLNVRGAKAVNALQRAAMEKSRLKIPLIFGFDVIHGYRTVFPIPLALASSFDPAVAERAARLSAREAYADGLRWTFSPMVDIARDPRWGRVAEGAGEDPFLGAAMARAYVRGYQGEDPSAPDTLAACVKHWVGYGAAEAGRDYSTTEISERTLREIYFPPFRAAADAGALTFMSAFNDLDGIPSSANRFTLTDVLRGEFGFRGFVVSDWDAVSQLIPHGIAADGADAARLALNAGVDMEMDSRLYGSTLPKLLKEGRVSTSTVDEAVRRILRVKMKLGLFEHPYADESRAAGAPDAESRAAARSAAVKSMVLLKNDGAVLPLSKDLKNVAVIGPVGNDGAAVLGSWFGDGRSTEAVTLLDGIRAALPNATAVYSTGCSVKGETDEGFAAAVAAAKNSDAVILTLGEAGDMTGEATSRAYLDVPGRQLDLAKAVLSAGRPTVVVLLNGRPLTIPWLAEHAPSILEAWQPGTEGGSAVADVLFGDANPGGKLPITFPRAVGQIPLYYDHKNTGRPPEDDNHYTSKYQDLPVTPLFPFGYGLSYAKFSLGATSLSAKKIRTNGSLTVSTALENIGTRPGDEVVQLYIHRVSGSVTRPVRELKGFARVSLKPGDKKIVSFELGPKELGFYGADMKWRNEPGEVEVYVGTDSAAGLGGRFVVDQ
ncbi:MAG: glycoside hydrolase family 3 C-terminal domain-containing protein [Elusimicrobia bacterium]|nr:glycoside hydrolase family 3 C-terminal domain-containing protein [Elusimicrobiota bacterium]